MRYSQQKESWSVIVFFHLESTRNQISRTALAAVKPDFGNNHAAAILLLDKLAVMIRESTGE
ncbi:hypothetical protein Enr17x_37560 [Gimesia fumaroli]|uniref:Uncharacterized protein n=1 Tax=Gimesia fumaroli TaxID=2527976 RepID=A0A518IF61_9PLAN|nr:hypothetical protein Enr17x_37560 [Gimesia fumaroli]